MRQQNGRHAELRDAKLMWQQGRVSDAELAGFFNSIKYYGLAVA